MKSVALFGGAIAAASRSGESTDLLQVGSLDALRAGAMTMDVKDMKAEVLNMVHAPADARGQLTTIEDLLVNRVMPSLEAENTGDQQAHSSQIALFATQASEYADNLAALSSADIASNARGTHNICRTAESGLHGAKVICDGEEVVALSTYQTAKSNFDGAGTTLGVRGDHHCSATSSADVFLGGTRSDFDTYKSKFDTVADKYISYNDKTVECAGRTTTLTDKTVACNGFQRYYEDATCVYAIAFKAEQEAYKNRYSALAQGYGPSSSAWTVASTNRVAQCDSVQTVICYIRALNAHNEEADLTNAIATCDAADHETDCQQYGFTPNAVPTMATLDPLPKVCDEAGFVYYSNGEPSGTTLADCNKCLGLRPPSMRHVGDDGCTSSNKCGRCVGDCDYDSQCEDGLKCFQRGSVDIPGCGPGGSGDVAGHDYCYDPNPEPVPLPMLHVGNDGCTSSNKCAECIGDCDHDSDCEDGLKCFQRGSVDIPGCAPGGNGDVSHHDYCYRPPAL